MLTYYYIKFYKLLKVNLESWNVKQCALKCWLMCLKIEFF